MSFLPMTIYESASPEVKPPLSGALSGFLYRVADSPPNQV
jgi:hypothetical protein